VIALSQISVVEPAQEKGYTRYSFDIRTHKGRKHRFSCSNNQDLVDWLSSLESLIWGDFGATANVVSKQTEMVTANSNSNTNGANEKEKDKKEEERPITPRLRGSFSGFADKFKQLTSTKKQTHYVATVTPID